MDPRIKFALISTLLFGLGSPIAKISVNNYGLDPRIFVIINGVCSAIVGLTVLAIQGHSDNANYGKLTAIPIVLAVIAGLVMNSSYLLSNLSLSLRGGSVALTSSITMAAPLISILIGIVILGESKNIFLLKFLTGAFVTAIGTYITISSIKPN